MEERPEGLFFVGGRLRGKQTGYGFRGHTDGLIMGRKTDLSAPAAGKESVWITKDFAGK